jgi:putative mRNA 3-end processing factor
LGAFSFIVERKSHLDLIASTERGLYCAAGDFHIDPWRPVSRAIITHAHSDHARFGSEVYVCHPDTAPILRKRLGDVTIETATYGQILTRNGVELSLHPAGHVLGSAQVRVTSKGETWVASGDYKLESDGVSPAFEPLRCHAFITESTFGLPIYRWRPQADTFAAIDAWRRENIAAGRASILYAYALGKAQRLIAHVDPALGPIVCHGAVEAINALYREAGIALPPTCVATDPRTAIRGENKRDFARALVVAPPSAAATPWLKRFGDYSDALASGWMQVRGNRRRRGLDRGFALSDHADWPGLIAAIEATGAERILVTHGYTETLTRYLREKGLDARALTTSYGDDEDVGDAGTARAEGGTAPEPEA